MDIPDISKLKDNLPKDIPDISKLKDNLPKDIPDISKLKDNLPKDIPDISKLKDNLPKDIPDISKLKDNLPKDIPDISKLKDNLPKDIPDISKLKDNLPKDIPDISKLKDNLPKDIPDISKLKDNLPKDIPDVSKLKDNLPSVPPSVANLPKDIPDIPKLKDNLPSVPPPMILSLATPRVFPPTLIPPPQQQYPPMLAAQQGPPMQYKMVRQRKICDETPEARRARIKRVTVSAVKEIAKTVVLILCVTLYAVLGALAFQALEQPNEKDTCIASEKLYDKMENDTANSMWMAANQFRDAEQPDLQEAAIERMIQNFTDNVLNLGYGGKDCAKLGQKGGPQYDWNFPGALLFSVTVFTTVGYGNITPKTAWGRMFCIAYAMIGLPLMFFTLANIGEHMAIVFRFVYVKVCCLGLCAKRRQPPPPTTPRPQPWGATPNTPVVQDDDDDDEDEDEEEITIPLTLTLLVIAGYIGLGALIFAVWENWDAMGAAYFTFVTVSTIGLGDMVPGFNNTGSDAEGSLKLLTCAAYMLFGMALLSMGFDLIQYEMANKITAIGGQNVGRAGDTVNELQGKDDNEMDPDVAPPTRNIQPLPRGAHLARPSIEDVKGPDFGRPVSSKVSASHF